MPCQHPSRAYLSGAGRPKFWKPTQPEYSVEPYTGLLLPCGYCELCRAERARQWAIRIKHEARYHQANCMVTLTYDDQHEPEHHSLRRSDVTKFLKRLRKAGYQFKYLYVGEHGDKTGRPHYHLVIFGQDFLTSAIFTNQTPGHTQWTNLELAQIWKQGRIEIVPLNETTAAYVAGYLCKKQRAKQTYVRVDQTTGELIPLEQPVMRMSQGLARRWYDDFNQGVKDWDRVIMNARPQKPPRAYDKLMKEEDPDSYHRIKQQRATLAIQNPQTQAQRNARAEASRQRRQQSKHTI